jgi:Domain of unknown function DUF29
MPEGLRIRERHEDAYAWALEQAARLRRGGAGLKGIDRAELGDFLEEWAEEMLSGARSQLVNLMAHAAKVARSQNPAVLGHWHSECVEFHDRLVEEYRPSMRDKIDMANLWRRARRKVTASFADHGEPAPVLAATCPFTLDELIEPDLDVERLVARLRSTQ